ARLNGGDQRFLRAGCGDEQNLASRQRALCGSHEFDSVEVRQREADEQYVRPPGGEARQGFTTAHRAIGKQDLRLGGDRGHHPLARIAILRYEEDSHGSMYGSTASPTRTKS